MAHDAGADRPLIVQAAEEAGRIALEHFRRDVTVREKAGGQGPVTAADLAVDAYLRETLHSARTGYGWLSEETADGPGRLTADRVFVVDPIDGTRAFIAGEKGWSVAVAVVERGCPIAAAVHLPARGETYAAALGQGATLDGRPIAASRRAVLDGASALASKGQLRDQHWPGGVPPVRHAFRTSLAWRLCLVAAGRYDLMVTLRDTWEWDIAAGSLIAAEAGATVTDGRGGPLAFNRAPPATAGVIAAPASLHAELMRRRSGVRAD